jgi:phosphatidylcholine synthase
LEPQGEQPARVRRSLRERLPAYAVHVLTASGGAMAFVALLQAIDGRLATAFTWLAIAMIVDGVDGTIARVLQVRERLPDLSGDVLDLVVDFTTYVFVPALILVYSNLWPRDLAIFWGICIIVTAALYFADLRMKTADNWFAGFPAVWNVVAFYLVVYAPPAWLATVIIGVAAIGQALPVVFVHPFRVRQFKPLTLTMCVVWTAAAFVAIAEGLKPDAVTHALLLVCAAYFVALGLLRKVPQGTAEED